MEKKTVLAGNIGVPVLDIVDDIQPDTIIVLELSSHQLEFVHASPHIGILLNLFEEHLDHYNSFADYQQAKFNIARYQSPEDYFICHTQDELAAALLKKKKIKSELRGFSLDKDGISKSYVRNNFFCTLQGKKEAKICGITDEFPLQGEHNLLNTTSVIAALSCLPDMDLSRTEEAINSFKCLPHRLEYVGKKGGIIFYNDSISTIPQASIAAVRALKNVNTIILGGFDRGVDYQPLVDFLENSAIEHFIFTGEAGKRMLQLFHKREDKEFLFRETYEEIVALAKSCTKRGGICLLSPAAASYDQFQNFEQRGNRFRKLVLTM
jgi:UDP-N-acetylmuramoylalanine--D-glutamate ligase